MSEIAIKPSRGYYVLAALVLAAGLAGAAVFVVRGISDVTDFMESWTQMVVPGQHELTLAEAGEYTVYHEYRSSIEGKVYSMEQGSLPGLECTLLSKASGEQIPLSEATVHSTYSFGSRSGVSVFDFEVSSPGTYVFSAQYSEGQEGPEAVMAVGQGIVKEILVAIFGALVSFFVGIGVAIAITVITCEKRKKARKRLQDAAAAPAGRDYPTYGVGRDIPPFGGD